MLSLFCYSCSVYDFKEVKREKKIGSKKALVWTANEAGSQRHFLCTKVDGLITDNVSQAMKIALEMGQRSDLDRMVDKIKTMF